MDQTVPLWAFVALGLAAPSLALIGVLISVRAESKRSHRNWLRETKYEAYSAMLRAYRALTTEFGDHLNRHVEGRDASDIERLQKLHDDCKVAYERAMLLASMRVSLAAEMELLRTWFQAYSHLEAHRLGEGPPGPPDAWGGEAETCDAIRYDLGVRRDRELLGRHYDRRSAVPASRMSLALQRKWWAVRSRVMGYDK